MNTIRFLAADFWRCRWRFVYILYWIVGWFGGAATAYFQLPSMSIIIFSVLGCLWLNHRHYQRIDQRLDP
jgi:hypothetical protein